MPLSREAPTLAVLGVAALVIVVQAPRSARLLGQQLTRFLDQDQPQAPDMALRAAGLAALSAAAPFLLAALAAGAAAVLAQTRGRINLSALLPDLGRLSPSHGLNRILSAAALLELGKALVKLALAGSIVWSVLAEAAPGLPGAMLMPPGMLLERVGAEVLWVLAPLLIAQLAITGFDVLRAQLSHAWGLRMTRQEVRDEHKESEGDPHIKARIKRLRFQRARKRMLLAVPKATVVITNPTHYAVALAYQRGSTGAPRVVAKGMDAMAARIREIAREHNVPMVASPQLARALYPVELDGEIPHDLFQAVAEIIAYIWGLGRRMA